jgi:acetyl esterase/lipase
MKPLLAGIAFAALAGPCAAAHVEKDVIYAAPAGLSQRLDLCIPDGRGPFPAVVIVHGGGWAAGDKEDPNEVQPILPALTKGRIAWFTINYRLSRQARYPACVEDVEAAVQFVRAHASAYRLDPSKIALSGDSAGGHLVSMVAVRATPDHPERRLAAVICFYGANDLVEDSFRRNGPSPSLQALFRIPPGTLDRPTVQLLQDASPLAFVTPQLPPFLLLHGTADASVDYPGSVIWQEDLTALGVPCRLITIPHGVHVMGNWDRMDPAQTAYKQQLVDWLRGVFDHPLPPARPEAARVRPKGLAGLWRVPGATGVAGIYLAADGTGQSISGPSAPLRWTFEPGPRRVHIEYPPGEGREVPYAGSPDLPEGLRQKILKAGVRPKVGFADWRYFPLQDLMISSNGEIFRRQPKAAADAARKAAVLPAGT